MLFIPLPVLLYSPFRSSYYLLKPKSTSRPASDYEQQSPDDIDPHRQQMDELDERVTNTEIDSSIPIKLLFLVNAMPLDKIINDTDGKLAYCTGDPTAVGMKLMELDKVHE